MTYIVPPPADQAPARSRCGYDSSNDVRGGLPWARAAPARCATPAVARTLVAPSPSNSSGRRRSDAATSCSRSEPVTAFSSWRARPVASSQGSRPALDRRSHEHDDAVLRSRRAVHPLRRRDGALLRAGGERRAELGPAGRGRQSVRRKQRDPRARRRIRRRRARLDLLERRRVPERAVVRARDDHRRLRRRRRRRPRRGCRGADPAPPAAGGGRRPRRRAGARGMQGANTHAASQAAAWWYS
jgi:hypothetical protein